MLEIQKVGGLAVGSQIVLRQLEPHSGGIAIALFSVVHRESQLLGRAVFRANGVARSVVNVAIPHCLGR